MTDAEFYRIHTFLKSRYGLDMSSKKEIVKGRLENYVRNQGYTTYQSYMDALEADITGELENIIGLPVKALAKEMKKLGIYNKF